MRHSAILHSGFLFISAIWVCLGCGSGGGDGSSAPVTVVMDSYTTQTADNVTIALKRYRASTGSTYREPVLMSQGFLEGQRVFNGFQKHSMVNDLALEGFDVWTFDVRATGDSPAPDISWGAINVSIDWTTFDWSLGMKGWNFYIDHFIYLDTPAAIKFILATTGAKQFLWVGHSTGGLMQYGYLQTNDASKVKAGLTLGGLGMMTGDPGYQSLFSDLFFGIGMFLAPVLPSNMPLPVKWGFDQLLTNDIQKWALASYALCTPVGKIFWNSNNMNPNLVYQFLHYALPNTSTNVFKQFMAWAAAKECTSYGIKLPKSVAASIGANLPGYPVVDNGDETMTVGQNFSFSKNMGRIKCPMMVLAGGGDLMCGPSNCQAVYAAISSPEKVYHECSIATGHSVDYGHVDMCMGLNARTEVYPHVIDWCKSHASQ